MAINIRPYPPVDYTDAWSSNVGQAINSSQLRVGDGLTLRRDSSGTIISLDSDMDPYAMNYVGVYSFTQSYAINDVVFVDPTKTYWDETNSILPICSGSSSTGLPPICGGLFICVQPVAPYGYDQTYLTGSIQQAYANVDQQINSNLANTFRWYDYNCYYPIYPTIPSGSLTSVAVSVGGNTCEITANQTYWAPLSPMLLIQMCGANGNITNTYINGIMSGSVYNPDFLPYSP